MIIAAIHRRLIKNKNVSINTIKKWARLSNGDLRKRKDVYIGDFSYGCPNVRTGGGISSLYIGKYCCIGKNVSIHLVSDHHTDWITTYDFSALIHGLGQNIDRDLLINKGNVYIGNDVWIGENVTILPGIKVNDGCVIGAGSIVTHDVPAYHIVGGNPAKIIRMRFTERETRILKEIKWWNWDEKEVFNAKDLLESKNIEALYKFWQQNIINKQ